jgi:hypothetical protein
MFVWFVAFTATLYNKMLLAYQPCQLVKGEETNKDQSTVMNTDLVQVYT